MMTRSLLATTLVAFLSSTSLTVAAEVSLRAISMQPLHDIFSEPAKMLFNKINEMGKGSIKIDLAGGPEMIPPPQLANAVKTGVVDVVMIVSTIYKGMVFEVESLQLATMDYPQRRKNGAIDYLDKLHQEKMNTHLMTGYGDAIPLHLFMRKPLDKLDLTGLTIRSSPTYETLLKSLGAKTAVIIPSEVHTALERNIIDGFGYPAWGLREAGLESATKYRIDPGFYRTSVTFLMNLDKYKSLDAAQKKTIKDAVTWFEDMMPGWAAKVTKDQYASQEKAGIKAINLAGGLAERAAALYWEELEKGSPQHIPALRKMLAP